MTQSEKAAMREFIALSLATAFLAACGVFAAIVAYSAGAAALAILFFACASLCAMCANISIACR